MYEYTFVQYILCIATAAWLTLQKASSNKIARITTIAMAAAAPNELPEATTTTLHLLVSMVICFIRPKQEKKR